ncbi:MAG: NYN domain-containing protein [Patescibacteria group bacterium]
MDPKIEKSLNFLNNKKVGVFCDDSNLYKAYQKYGWRIDLGKFRKLLGGVCDLKFINYYIGIPDKSDAVYSGTQKFLENIKSYVIIKEKKLKYTPVGGKFIKKADVDVEITLDIVRMINKLDIIIILSGDSDLLELRNYVVKENNKNIIFWAYEKNMAWELKYCWHLFLDDFQKEISLDLK